MKTYWLVVQSAHNGRIDPAKCRRVDGSKKEAELSAAALRLELGNDFLITVETDKEARLYKSYRQFPGSDREAY